MKRTPTKSNEPEPEGHDGGVEDRLADFTTDDRVLQLSILAVLIGAISAVVAAGLLWLIGEITNISFYGRFSSQIVPPAGGRFGYWAVLVPVIGGLIVGLMARFGSEKIRGHGIPEAMEAILTNGSRIEPKIALLKPISSAIAIGTGGPFGAEGPIVMTGGAIGSLFAQFFNFSSAERKTLLVAGAAGGMSAIFGAPIAAVFLGVELLLFEWKPRSIIPVALSSAVAAAVRVLFLGAGPMFPLAPHAPLPWIGILAAVGVGIVAGFGSRLVTEMVYGVEDLFRKLPIHWMWWPAIGGLFVGIGGIFFPRTMGVGYDVIRALLHGQIVGGVLLGLLIGKAVIWAVSLGSGTSGGVWAPLLIIGGALGALEGHWIPVGSVGIWALLSMAAVLSGTIGSPFTAIVFSLEVTHDLNVVVPLLVACTAAYAVSVLILRRSILTEKVARHGHHVLREYIVDPLEVLRVNDVMTRNVEALPANIPVAEALRVLTSSAANTSHGGRQYQGYPVVDAHQRVLGLVTQADALKWARGGWPKNANLSSMVTGHAVVAYADEPLSYVANRMAKAGMGRIPVVQREGGTLVGIVSRSDLLQARLRYMSEEADRSSVLSAKITLRRDRRKRKMKGGTLGGTPGTAETQGSGLTVTYRGTLPNATRRVLVARNC